MSQWCRCRFGPGYKPWLGLHNSASAQWRRRERAEKTLRTFEHDVTAEGLHFCGGQQLWQGNPMEEVAERREDEICITRRSHWGNPCQICMHGWDPHHPANQHGIPQAFYHVRIIEESRPSHLSKSILIVAVVIDGTEQAVPAILHVCMVSG